MKSLVSVLTSVVLSVGIVLGLTHWYPVSFTSIRAATYKVSGDLGHCSGVMIAENQFLTAAHCDMPNMKIDGKSAVVLKKDEKLDLMLLVVQKGCPCVPVAKNDPGTDTKVYVIGYPLYMGQTLTEGRLQPLFKDSPFRQFSAPTIFGNSGGPVIAMVNGRFQVVGVVSAIAGDVLYGMFPYVVPHLAIAASTDSINKFLDS